MNIKKVSIEELQKALEETNKKYDNNVIFNNLQKKGNNFIVTLKVKDSHGKGSRLGFPDNNGKQRHMTNACWHVHGDFFDNLLAINDKAIIITAQSKIFKDLDGETTGNWEDKNIGSIMHPLYYSEACECSNWST